jgi:hypothetical protein
VSKIPGIGVPHVVAVALAIVLLHAVNLTADTPAGFASGDIGLRVDEGYKTLAARNLVLFGTQRWSDEDEYAGWLRSSPLTQGLLYVSFAAFEPSISVARITSLAYLLILAAGILLAVRGLSPVYFGVMALLLAVEPYLFFFSRVALFEVPLAMTIVLGLLCLRRLDERPVAALLVMFAAMLAAFLLLKASAVLYFAPALAALSLLSFSRGRPALTLGLVAAGIATAVLLLAVTESIWAPRLDFGPGTVTRHFLGNALAVWSPWLAGAAWVCVADVLRRRGGQVLAEPYAAAVFAMVVGIPILLALFNYAPPRYYVAAMPAYLLAVAYWLERRGDEPSGRVSPPLAVVCTALSACGLFWFGWALVNGLSPVLPIPQGDDSGLSVTAAIRYLLPIGIGAAIAMQWLGSLRARVGAGLTAVFVAVALCLAVVDGLYHASRVWLAPEYGSHEVRRNLRDHVPADQAVIGDWATFFALGTGIPAIYSSTEQNQGEILLALCPGFFLDSGTRHDATVIASYEALEGVELGPPAVLGTYADAVVRIHSIRYPDDSCG